MCYGGLDTKYVLREMEDRMKGVAFQVDKSEEPGQMAAAGCIVRLRDFFRRKTRKDLVNG